MAHCNHPEATGPVAVAYPPPPASYPPLPALPPGQVNSSPLPQSYPPPSIQAGYPQGPYVASPPVAYPVKNELPLPQQPTSDSHPPESKRRGDGFWHGCCAALCCCCLLDMCFRFS